MRWHVYSRSTLNAPRADALPCSEVGDIFGPAERLEPVSLQRQNPASRVLGARQVPQSEKRRRIIATPEYQALSARVSVEHGQRVLLHSGPAIMAKPPRRRNKIDLPPLGKSRWQ